MFEKKNEFRDILESKGLLKLDRNLTKMPYHPTTSGVDGAFALEKLLYTDIVAMAGVAVEGLTPPSEKRHWP